MATSVDPDQAPSVTGLVTGIMKDAQELLKQEFHLLQAEVRADISRAKAGAQVLGLGAAIVMVGSVLLGFALAYWLKTVAEDIPLWGCLALCGGGFAVLGGIICAAGWFQLHAANPLNSEAGDALRENLPWTTKTTTRN